MSLMIDPDEFLANTETAQVLRQKPETLTAWRHLGKGPPYFKVGRQVFYRRADLAEWLGTQRRKPASSIQQQR